MHNGLEDVVAAETVLSEVDGQRGQLLIRGASLDELGGQPFEAVVHRLLDGFFPDLPNLPELTAAMGRARLRVFDRLQHTVHRSGRPAGDRSGPRAAGAFARR